MPTRRSPVQPQLRQVDLDDLFDEAAAVRFARIIARQLARQHHEAEEQARRREAGQCAG